MPVALSVIVTGFAVKSTAKSLSYIRLYAPRAALTIDTFAFTYVPEMSSS